MKIFVIIVLSGYIFFSGLLQQLTANAAENKTDFTPFIINSNHAVQKYRLVQDAFLSNSPAGSIEKDLGAANFNFSDFKLSILNDQPDVFYCIGTKAYLLAHKIIKNNKIVFSSAINWQRLPLGKKTYGIANEVPAALQLTMFRNFFPDIKKIGIIYSKIYNNEWLQQAKRDAQDVGTTIVDQSIGKPSELASALAELLPNIEALWLTADPIVLADEKAVLEIFKQTQEFKKPIFAYDDVYTNYGATLIIMADTTTIGVQAASLADELNSNAEIIDRVQNPAGSFITLNLHKIAEYHINLNKNALDSVNTIID